MRKGFCDGVTNGSRKERVGENASVVSTVSAAKDKACINTVIHALCSYQLGNNNEKLKYSWSVDLDNPGWTSHNVRVRTCFLVRVQSGGPCKTELRTFRWEVRI